ncbi:hypothetical protein [Hyella patelloides]|uniref:hypothetical protein n=1 Tax=Hyella patelloides TaxID=1982969 RepID=UPI00119D1592|nr:hypothetical protein [Hyella patelloides]
MQNCLISIAAKKLLTSVGESGYERTNIGIFFSEVQKLQQQRTRSKEQQTVLLFSHTVADGTFKNFLDITDISIS